MTLHELLTTLELKSTQMGGVTHVSVAREVFTKLATALTHVHTLPLSLLFATDDRKEQATFGVHALFHHDEEHVWLMVSTTLPQEDARYESLTKTIMAAHWYERLMQDQFGLIAEDHPDPRRLVHHENVPLETYPLRKDFAWNTKMEHANVPYPMHHVDGEGIYEIPVGPIHAGIIEPGHFRFNVAGERIITLEGKLFFTHKGVEKLMENKSVTEALPFAERVSGDASASHTLAYCQAVEAAFNTHVPERAQAIRTLLTELERITMHVHDISNMAGMGTGFTVMAAQGFRIKEEMMRLSAELLGNRFWRGAIVPGGVSHDFTDEQLKKMTQVVIHVTGEIKKLFEMGRHSDGLRERLETTGHLKNETALAYGALGLAARGSGIGRDVRKNHPYAAYTKYPVEVFTFETGDVYARWKLRMLEISFSCQLIQDIVNAFPKGSTKVDCHGTEGMGIGAVESWRGEVVYVVRMKNGVIDRCVVRDPSFCNWALFGELGPGNIVPDFPLCNKSLNLSYSGTDL